MKRVTLTYVVEVDDEVLDDDAALGTPLCEGLKGERQYVDWEKVEQLIFRN